MTVLALVSCYPFYSTLGDGQAGCTGICSSCTMKTSESGNIIDNGGFIESMSSASFASPGVSLPGPVPAMFDLPDIQSALSSFLQQIYQGQSIPNPPIVNGMLEAPIGYKIVPLRVAGRGVISIIPENAVPLSAMAASKASCSCSSGTCILDSKTVPFAGTVYWCTGNCDGTCTLTFSDSINQGGHEFEKIICQMTCYRY